MMALALSLAPSLLALALTPGFTTQDGPAHIFSARILNASFQDQSPFNETFEVVWQPLPNWVGHLVTMLAVALYSPEVANRIVTGATLVGFASAICWLRWTVAGAQGIELAAILAVIFGLNMTWLMGFTSFLCGATVATLTLAVWWSGRDEFGPVQAGGLGFLLVLGYFCHPISLGLTLAGLGTLVITTPTTRWRRRAIWTTVGFIPLVPLSVAYRNLTRSGGALEPTWNHWPSWSWTGLRNQLSWVDPLSLAAKTTTPGQLWPDFLPNLTPPAIWTLLGLVILGLATWPVRIPGQRGWLILALGLVGCGVVAPDTLGVKHGHYLPQRVVLLGLVALLPWLNLDGKRLSCQWGGAALVIALTIQSLFVWDYARTCHDRITPFLRVVAWFKPADRVGTLLNEIGGRFRSNPLLHADGLIAATSDSIFWTNYETAQYYFPVRVRPELPHPIATQFEQVAIRDDPREVASRAKIWADLLYDHGVEINKILEWRTNPQLDELTRLNYVVSAEEGPIRIWTRLLPPR